MHSSLDKNDMIIYLVLVFVITQPFIHTFFGAASCRDKVCGCRLLLRLEAVPKKKWPRIYNFQYLVVCLKAYRKTKKHLPESLDSLPKR